MKALLRHCCALLLAAASMLAGTGARADTDIRLFQSFAGNVNFVGTQKTMRTASNAKDPCAAVGANTELSATLAGIPAGATILSAQLYWAASNSSADYTVTFQGSSVSAPSTRRYFSNTVGYDYFGGAADVTTQVKATRNGTYTFKGLNVNTGSPYCSVQGVIGGFSLLVVYSNPAEQYRVLNIYEGFRYILNSALTLTLSNFLTPTPLDSATGRVAHITWEGDATLVANGERLMVNGVEMTDSLNPSENQFNSASNINNDAASYGIDFDAYTIGSPVIAAGQSEVKTLYQSGQDLVLLNVEVIAMPNVLAADLSISMVRNNELKVNASTSYTLTVSNIGPSAEAGPVVVTNTLPAGMSFVSASGSNWTCSVSGQVITCRNSAALAVGASLPPLTVAAMVNTSGSLTNTATVAGSMFDNVAANNSDSDTGAVASPVAVFTDKICVAGKAFGDPAQPCKMANWAPLEAGTVMSKVFLTVLTQATGVPTALSNKDAIVQIQVALSCHNPTTYNPAAGTKATFAGVILPLCTPNGAAPGTGAAEWSATVNAAFPAHSPSAPMTAGFQYNDVGKVAVYLRDLANTIVGGLPFVSMPSRIVLSVTGNPAPVDATGGAFVAAGVPFSMTIGAYTALNVPAPNFGRESSPQTFSLKWPVVSPFPDMTQMPALSGTFGAIALGAASGSTFSWPEVGILPLTPGLASGNYLGGGVVPGATVNVGRFVPDHFDTETAAVNACPANMGCVLPISRMAYSAQSFATRIIARNATNDTVQNYQGAFARALTMTAWTSAGLDTGANPNGGTLAGNSVATSAFTRGTADFSLASLAPTLTYILPRPFSSAAPRALDWSTPTVIYLRASETAVPAVTSKRATGSVEGGIMIASGRLQVQNAFGSELMMMPVDLRAQYWTGGTTGRWENNSADNSTLLHPLAPNVSYSNCSKALQSAVAAPNNCKDVFSQVSGAKIILVAGAGKIRLRPLGSGNTGSVEIRLNNPSWLPVAPGRLVFGIYKSPLIYFREVY
ncbi:DUF6701 domain-containing protein [Massilia psychrophila]|uniref:Uncharacterized protein n=1 Tax=Massilia psychrophila TaxID=1603353 RepID=A0A2G8SZ33_9BURK|nr:DUF6701 domain-containing protein [Massilia psychrophila]PIL38992.1 hypothetical protein CR103_15030 [Massilia psychrophila]GGE88985.1 hypothetical protein GCM10008020_37520 [Massilia psychrophila]